MSLGCSGRCLRFLRSTIVVSRQSLVNTVSSARPRAHFLSSFGWMRAVPIHRVYDAQTIIRHFNALAVMRRISPVELGALLAIAVSYFIIWPVGEYAVLDDWTYMKSLEHLHFHGRLQVLDINPISVVGLLLWAWPFTKIFGFSFTVAKLSVVALHVIECLAFVRLLRLCGVCGSLAFAAVMTLIFNPLHFVHSFTFLTDVPAIAWQTVAALCYARAISRHPATNQISSLPDRHQSTSERIWNVGVSFFSFAPRSEDGWRWLVCGSLAGAIAFLVRQSGIVVPLAWLVYAVLLDRSYLHWRAIAAGLGPFAATAGGFGYWYVGIRGPTSTFESKARQCLEFLLYQQASQVIFLCFAIVAYMGFFLCPLSLIMRSRWKAVRGKRRLAFVVLSWGVVNLFLYCYAYHGKLFPYFINVITRFGFFTTNDIIVGDRDVVWGDAVQWAMNVAILLSLLAVMYRACAYTWRPPEVKTADRVLRFLLVLLALQLFYSFATSRVLFDRHLLILAPTSVAVFCLLARESIGPNLGWFSLALAPLIFYSIAGAHDVYAMSRAAFSAGDALIAEGVDPKFIDGGYAFDGWYMYERPGRDARPRLPSDPWWLRKFFRGIDEKYIVSSSTSYDVGHYLGKADVPPGPGLKDYEVFKSYSYRGLWPWKTQYVFVMKRTNRRGDR